MSLGTTLTKVMDVLFNKLETLKFLVMGILSCLMKNKVLSNEYNEFYKWKYMTEINVNS